jgi:predicted ATP-grasp superfamily ATP-dependent carboligase
MSVLVTASDSPKALSVIRSLGRAGIPVTAAADRKSSLGSSSKYCTDTFRYPSPRGFPEEYFRALSGFLNHHPHDVLMPVHSEDTYLIAKYQECLSKLTKIPLHTFEAICEVNDKSRLIQVARELAIPCPEMYVVKDLSDLGAIIKKAEFPLVIKVRDSSGSRGVDYASSPEELKTKFSSVIKKHGLTETNYPIIQEYIKGEGYGVSMLFNKGEPRAKCTHRRLREYPITGGPSTLRESVNHPAMEKIARDLLGHYQWHGLAMVEFKLRDSDKKPVLIEVNPRMWGSINLSILAGVDFPHLLYTMAMEGDVKPVLSHATGICSRNSFSDILAMGSYLVHTGGIKNFGAADLYPLNDDIISAEDPLPFFRFLKTGFKFILNRT